MRHHIGFFVLYAFCIITTANCAVGELKDVLQGGGPVVGGELPWFVGLLDISLGDEVKKLVCGGSILSPCHILTSGRCVTKWEPENRTHITLSPQTLKVIAGDVSRMEDEETEQIRPIVEIILHPEFFYDPGYKGGVVEGTKKGFKNDLAILVVDPPLNLTADGVHAIQVGEQYDATELKIAGWGITDKRQNTIPTGITLKQVTLPFTSKLSLKKEDKKLSKQKPFGLWFDSDGETIQFSSGTLNNNGLMGKCMGDQGSAVVAQGPLGWVQVGVVSFGVWCDRYLPTGQLTLLTSEQMAWVGGVVNPKMWAYVSGLIIFIVAAVSGVAVRVGRRNRLSSMPSPRRL